MGYTLDTSMLAFQNWINFEQESTIKYKTIWENNKSNSPSIMINHYEMKSQILKELTPELWLKSLKTIQFLGLEANSFSRVIIADMMINISIICYQMDGMVTQVTIIMCLLD